MVVAVVAVMFHANGDNCGGVVMVKVVYGNSGVYCRQYKVVVVNELYYGGRG